MGKIFLTPEEPQERSTLAGSAVADGATKHGVTVLKCVEDRTNGHLTRNFELHLVVDLGQISKVIRKRYKQVNR